MERTTAGGGPQDRVRRHAWVRGRVQGVGFRVRCAEAAAHVGTAGWVRNLDDGRVELVAEGPLAAVDALIAWARTGPPHAAVAAVEVVDEEPEGLTGFAVLADR